MSDREDIVARGTLDEIMDEFERRQWSDGLPIVPPTLAAVSAFMRHTDRPAGESLGELLPSRRQATVWSVAVNGVMAGCRPEYMPLLIAIVEVIADPTFRVADAGCTPGWEPLVVVNGEAIQALGFNYEGNVMRIGRRANSTAGRFLRLYLRNVAGFIPGETDKGCIATNFHVACAENEEFCREVGWPTYGEMRGFAAGQSVATVQSVRSSSPPLVTSGTKATEHLDWIVDALRTLDPPATCSGIRTGKLSLLLVMSPYVARVMARDGLGKPDISRYIQQRTRITKGRLLDYARRSGTHAGYSAQSIQSYVDLGLAPAEYATAGLDDEVPIFPWAESINIVISGDPARNQSRAYINNHHQGPPTSRSFQLRAAAATPVGVPAQRG